MPTDPKSNADAPDLVPGRATAAGTRAFANRSNASPDHFARPDALSLASIGFGTLRGEPGGADDLLYRSALADYLERAGNVVVTALSDRFQTSERAVGRALRRALREGRIAREEVVVVTKGGALTPDGEHVRDHASAQRDLYATYIETGILAYDDIHRGLALTKPFLLDQIGRSRRNLGLATLDYYLIQEPEVHLRELGVDAFRRSLAEAFEALELAVSRGWIGAYGLATWDGFLLPDSDRSHLSIVDLFEIALDVGSADHHFRAIQLPYGLAMGEGAVLPSQLGPDGRARALLECLRDTGTAVFASAPLYGGRLIGRVPGFVRQAFPEARSDAAAAIQFARSTAEVHCVVVGMRELTHVEENMTLARVPRARPEIPAGLFAVAARSRSATP
ncbi:MAG: aldo/keto reductase [Myxococcota bacterium]